MYMYDTKNNQTNKKKRKQNKTKTKTKECNSQVIYHCEGQTGQKLNGVKKKKKEQFLNLN